MLSSSLAKHGLACLSLKIGAWTLLLLIAGATLVPIGLRPHVGPVGVERSSAFFLFGLIFALAYPRRIWPAVLIVLTGAAALEALQTLLPSRHGRWDDMGIKIAGGLLGIASARLVLRLLRRSATKSTYCGKP
jgi:hypothetical protein